MRPENRVLPLNTGLRPAQDFEIFKQSLYNERLYYTAQYPSILCNSPDPLTRYHTLFL